jgi:hypothetical protein
MKTNSFLTFYLYLTNKFKLLYSKEIKGLKMKNQNLLSAVTASLLLIGCGGGSSTPATNSTSQTTGTGFYVDAAISGIDYSCGTEEGTTDSQGEFTFEKEKDCTFKIGNLVLRELNATSLEDNLTVFEDNLEVARFLQTLDSDGNASNGIEILPETKVVLEEQNITEVPKNEALLVDVKDALEVKSPNAYNGNVVSNNEAQSHLNETSQRLTSEGRSTQNGVSNGANNSSSSGMGNNSNMNGNSNMGNSMSVTSTTLKDFNYVPYSKPLAIPALAPYTVDADGYKVFNLDINKSTTEFFTGVATITYGINSSVLGQTIRMHNGDKIKLAYNNNLSVATTMHGHGMHVPAMMDGGPMTQQPPSSRRRVSLTF